MYIIEIRQHPTMITDGQNERQTVKFPILNIIFYWGWGMERQQVHFNFESTSTLKAHP